MNVAEKIHEDALSLHGVLTSAGGGPANSPITIRQKFETVRWSWASRILGEQAIFLDKDCASGPAVGDLALVRVTGIGEHERIVTHDNKRLRIYADDLIVGVFGNRYATDAFEGEVAGVHDLSVLTAGGMIGTVRSGHRNMSRPTTVSFIGYLAGPDGARINLKRSGFRRRVTGRPPACPVIAVVGTAMNSGKTTASVKLAKALCNSGLRVASCKLTGSVSNRDQDEMRSAAPCSVLDFSDYGFPSTYLCDTQELLDLFQTMLADLENAQPQIVVMEIADGILQRETAMLLRNPTFRQGLRGVILSADNALSALYAAGQLKDLGHHVIAVSGAMTSSPLSIREFQDRSDIPVARSSGSGEELAETVSKFAGLRS
ncbi:MAG: hypothetical protein SFV51_21130 [Bryobacteraceae bacterium]|nr:hypothetical protein [Bryobacteraceae bacterium]